MIPSRYFLETSDVPSALALAKALEAESSAYEAERWRDYHAEVALGVSAGIAREREHARDGESAGRIAFGAEIASSRCS